MNLNEHSALQEMVDKSNPKCNEYKELYAPRWGIETSFRDLKYKREEQK